MRRDVHVATQVVDYPDFMAAQFGGLDETAGRVQVRGAGEDSEFHFFEEERTVVRGVRFLDSKRKCRFGIVTVAIIDSLMLISALRVP